MIEDALKSLTVRGRSIRVDTDGFVCLSDLHVASSFRKNRRPSDWQRLPTSNSLLIALHEKSVGKSHSFKFSRFWRSKSAPGGGTFAHPVVALAYAEYLSPKIAVEVREVFLRYRAADATLADDILERSSPEANEWAGVRALGRVKRNNYTGVLKEHGVEAPKDFAICTNETYRSLFDGPARQLRTQMGLPAKSNLRNALDTSKLTYVMAAETLATERIEDLDCESAPECQRATRTSADYIREAIERDRADRQHQKKLI